MSAELSTMAAGPRLRSVKTKTARCPYSKVRAPPATAPLTARSADSGDPLVCPRALTAPAVLALSATAHVADKMMLMDRRIELNSRTEGGHRTVARSRALASTHEGGA